MGGIIVISDDDVNDAAAIAFGILGTVFASAAMEVELQRGPWGVLWSAGNPRLAFRFCARGEGNSGHNDVFLRTHAWPGLRRASRRPNSSLRVNANHRVLHATIT